MACAWPCRDCGPELNDPFGWWWLQHGPAAQRLLQGRGQLVEGPVVRGESGLVRPGRRGVRRTGQGAQEQQGPLPCGQGLMSTIIPNCPNCGSQVGTPSKIGATGGGGCRQRRRRKEGIVRAQYFESRHLFLQIQHTQRALGQGCAKHRVMRVKQGQRHGRTLGRRKRQPKAPPRVKGTTAAAARVAAARSSHRAMAVH